MLFFKSPAQFNLQQFEAVMESLQMAVSAAPDKLFLKDQLSMLYHNAVNAHQKLRAIEDVSAQLAQRVHSISTFAKQQTQVSEKITKSMQAIGNISSETATVSRQAASAMKNMAATPEKLWVYV